MFRFSLLTLAGFVTAIGVACAAMINASPLISSISWTVTVLALAFATVAAVLTRSSRRSFWAGFAIVGWVFAVLTLSPVFGRLPASLLTTRLLERAAITLPQARDTTRGTPSPGPYYYAPSVTVTSPQFTISTTTAMAAPVPGYRPNPPTPTTAYVAVTPVPVQNTEFIESFVFIGQALCVLILALAGGLLGRLIVARNDRLASLSVEAS